MANYVTETAWDKDDEIDQRLIQRYGNESYRWYGLNSPLNNHKNGLMN